MPGQFLPENAGTFGYRSPPSGNLTMKATSRMADRPPRIRAFTPLNFPKGTLFNRVNFRYTTAAFTPPEPWALLRCANLPGDWALYAISVPRIESRAGLAHSFALRLLSDLTSRQRPLETPQLGEGACHRLVLSLPS